MRRLGALPVVLCLLLCGCPKPELTNRQQLRHFDLRRDANAVTASLFVANPPPTPKAPFFTQFSAEGQDALVWALAAKAGTADELLARLVEGPGENASDVLDQTQFSKRLIFSVSKKFKGKLPEPADRVDALRLRVRLHDDSARFISISRIESEYSTVELGKVTLGQSAELSGSITAKPEVGTSAADIVGGKIPLEATTGGKISRTLTEEVSLRQRFEALSPQIIDGGKEIVLYREGAVGIDLSGAFYLDAQITVRPRPVFEVIRFASLFKPDGTAVPPGQFKYRFEDVYAPRSVIGATFSGTYRLRHVETNYDSVVEGDDHVIYRLGSFPQQPVALVGEEETRARQQSWLLRAGPFPDSPALHYRDSRTADPPALLRFRSTSDASAFVAWLRADNANRTLDTHKQIVVDDNGAFRQISTNDVRDAQVHLVQ